MRTLEEHSDSEIRGMIAEQQLILNPHPDTLEFIKKSEKIIADRNAIVDEILDDFVGLHRINK